jgi:hypothetical protein
MILDPFSKPTRHFQVKGETKKKKIYLYAFEIILRKDESFSICGRYVAFDKFFGSIT